MLLFNKAVFGKWDMRSQKNPSHSHLYSKSDRRKTVPLARPGEQWRDPLHAATDLASAALSMTCACVHLWGWYCISSGCSSLVNCGSWIVTVRFGYGSRIVTVRFGCGSWIVRVRFGGLFSLGAFLPWAPSLLGPEWFGPQEVTG